MKSRLRPTEAGTKVLAVSNVRIIEQQSEIVLDSMLGKLARWLRILGVRVNYQCNLHDEDLIHLEQLVITRDVELAGRRIRMRRGAVLLKADDLKLQLASILRLMPSCPREEDIPLTRYCSTCGEVLTEVTPQDIDRLRLSHPVPESILKRHSKLWYCPRCRKLYWPGSHHAKMRILYRDVLKLREQLDLVELGKEAPVFVLLLREKY